MSRSLNEKKISQAKARLRRADVQTTSLFAASCSMASIIVACEFMISVIECQEDRIAELEEMARKEKETYVPIRG